MEYPKFKIMVGNCHMITVESLVYCKSFSTDSTWVNSGHHLVTEVGEFNSSGTFKLKIAGLKNGSKEWFDVTQFEEFTPKEVIDSFREFGKEYHDRLMKAIRDERAEWTEENVIDWLEENTTLETIEKDRLEMLESSFMNHPG